jgi:hypothetical protein
MTWRFDNSFRINSYKDFRLLLTKSIELVDDYVNSFDSGVKSFDSATLYSS